MVAITSLEQLYECTLHVFDLCAAPSRHEIKGFQDTISDCSVRPHVTSACWGHTSPWESSTKHGFAAYYETFFYKNAKAGEIFASKSTKGFAWPALSSCTPSPAERFVCAFAPTPVEEASPRRLPHESLQAFRQEMSPALDTSVFLPPPPFSPWGNKAFGGVFRPGKGYPGRSEGFALQFGHARPWWPSRPDGVACIRPSPQATAGDAASICAVAAATRHARLAASAVAPPDSHPAAEVLLRLWKRRKECSKQKPRTTRPSAPDTEKIGPNGRSQWKDVGKVRRMLISAGISMFAEVFKPLLEEHFERQLTAFSESVTLALPFWDKLTDEERAGWEERARVEKKNAHFVYVRKPPSADTSKPQAHFIDKLESDSDSDPDELPCRPNMSPGRVEGEAPRSSRCPVKEEAAGVEKKVEEPPPVEGLSLADALARAHNCAAGDDGEATPPASPVALDEVVVKLPETPSPPPASQQPPSPHPEEPFDLYAVLQCMPPPPPLGSPLPPSLLTLLRPGPHPPHPAFPFHIDPNGHLYRPDMMAWPPLRPPPHFETPPPPPPARLLPVFAQLALQSTVYRRG